MLEYYLAAALSFGIMYTYRYAWEIVQTVEHFRDINDMEEDWYKHVYLVFNLIIATIVAPLMLLSIVIASREDIIKKGTKIVLKRHFNWVDKENRY